MLQPTQTSTERPSMILFLGGTCNDSKWRDELIPKLDDLGIEYFNPVVDDWTPDCIEKENAVKARNDCVELYVITSAMTGVYSIAEAVDAAWRKKRSIFCINPIGFDHGQVRSLLAVSRLIEGIGGTVARPDNLSNTIKRFFPLNQLQKAASKNK